MDNDELIIKNALNDVNTPKYDIASEIDKNRSAKKSPSFKRHLVTTVVSLLLLTFTVGASAAMVSGFKYLVSIIGEENANLVTPVELSDEDQGIKMEVVAAGRFDNMLKVYVTLQDLTGERITEDVRIWEDSLKGMVTGINRSPSKGMGITTIGNKLIDYDKQNKKATMLYEMRSGDKLEGEKLILKINKILYNTKEVWNYKIEKDLTNADSNPAIYYVPKEQLFKNQLIDKFGEDDSVPVLKEQDEKIEFPETQTFKISAMGMIDDKLHVQVWRDKDSDESSFFSPYLNLKDSVGEYKNSDLQFSFDIEEGSVKSETDNPGYSEYVFDVGEDEIEQYELLANISESDVINGNWEVKFNSEDSGEILKTNCNLDVDGDMVEFVTINSFGGIRIEGKQVNNENKQVMYDVKINTAERQIIPSVSGGSNFEGQFTVFYNTEKPVELNSIVSIEINGQTVEFEK